MERRMEYLVSYSFSKQNWKKIFLRLLRFFFYLLLSLLAFSIWQTVNRIRVCIVCMYINFTTEKWLFDVSVIWNDDDCDNSNGNGINDGKAFSDQRQMLSQWSLLLLILLSLLFLSSTLSQSAFLRIANRFMSFQFFFAFSFFFYLLLPSFLLLHVMPNC